MKERAADFEEAGFLRHALCPNSGRCPRPDRGTRAAGPGFDTQGHGLSFAHFGVGAEMLRSAVRWRRARREVHFWETFNVKCPTCLVRVSSCFLLVMRLEWEILFGFRPPRAFFHAGELITPANVQTCVSIMKGLDGLGVGSVEHWRPPAHIRRPQAEEGAWRKEGCGRLRVATCRLPRLLRDEKRENVARRVGHWR